MLIYYQSVYTGPPSETTLLCTLKVKLLLELITSTCLAKNQSTNKAKHSFTWSRPISYFLQVLINGLTVYKRYHINQNKKDA